MSWQAICEWITNEWFGILAVIIGLVTSVYFYAISKRERRPCCFVKSNNIIKKAHEMIPGLKLHFAGYGDDLFDFTISKIVFWNKGRETIRKEDVASADPIKVNAKNGALILSANVIHQSNDSNQFRCVVNREKSVATISFDYVDHGQCVVLEIAHTGTDKDDIIMSGVIKGAPNGGRIERIDEARGRRSTSHQGRKRAFVSRCTAAIMVFVLIVQIILLSWRDAQEKSKFEAKQQEWAEDEATIVSLMFSAAATRQTSDESYKSAERVKKLLMKLTPEKPRQPAYFMNVISVILILTLSIQAYLISRRFVPKEAEPHL